MLEGLLVFVFILFVLLVFFFSYTSVLRSEMREMEAELASVHDQLINTQTKLNETLIELDGANHLVQGWEAWASSVPVNRPNDGSDEPCDH